MAGASGIEPSAQVAELLNRVVERLTLITGDDIDLALAAMPGLVSQRVLTRAQAARLLGVHEVSLRRLAESGDGPPVVELSTSRVGYRVADLATWLDSRRRGATGE